MSEEMPQQNETNFDTTFEKVVTAVLSDSSASSDSSVQLVEDEEQMVTDLNQNKKKSEKIDPSGEFSNGESPSVNVYSFATDLLTDYEAVKIRTNNNLKALEEFDSMLRARAALEETYAKGLEKIAKNLKENLCHEGSVKEAFKIIRIDLNNKADQHRRFSTHILTEVFQPIQDLRVEMNADIKLSNNLVLKSNRNCRNFEEKYRKSHSKYQKALREAVASEELLTAEEKLSNINKSEGMSGNHCKLKHTTSNSSMSSKVTTPNRFRAISTPNSGRCSQLHSPALSTCSSGTKTVKVTTANSRTLIEKYNKKQSNGSNRSTNSGGLMNRVLDTISGLPHHNKVSRKTSLASSNFSKPPSSPVAAAINAKSEVMINWLIPPKIETLTEALKSANKNLENSKKSCREAFAHFSENVRLSAHELQTALNKNQFLEEKFIKELYDGLKKSAIFESSLLANEQYDIQIVFQAVENFDGTNDLQKFIKSQINSNAEKNTLNDFSRMSSKESLNNLSQEVLKKVFNIYLPNQFPSISPMYFSESTLDSTNSLAKNKSVSKEIPRPPPHGSLNSPLSYAEEVAEELSTLLHLPLVSKHEIVTHLRNDLCRDKVLLVENEFLFPASEIQCLLENISNGKGLARQILP